MHCASYWEEIPTVVPKYVILIVVSIFSVLSISESNFIASGVFSSIFLALGMFESYLLGFLFHWRTMCFILSSQVNMVENLHWRCFQISFASQPVLMALALFFVRESPYWLASKGDKILFDNPPLDDDHQIPRRSSSNTKMMSIRKIRGGSCLSPVVSRPKL